MIGPAKYKDAWTALYRAAQGFEADEVIDACVSIIAKNIIKTYWLQSHDAVLNQYLAICKALKDWLIAEGSLPEADTLGVVRRLYAGLLGPMTAVETQAEVQNLRQEVQAWRKAH
jgi:hypothetical protein